MHESPLLVSEYFIKRSEIFINDVFKNIFDVTDIWWRYEWQCRGSPHVHGVAWLRNAPKIVNVKTIPQNIMEIKIFYDPLCFATVPNDFRTAYHPSSFNFEDINDGNRENDLINCINTFQKHTICSSSCMRYNRRTKKMQCRYDFPKKCQKYSTVENVNGYNTYLPKRDNAFVQRYNPLITSIWRANSDFSPTVSYEAVLAYSTLR